MNSENGKMFRSALSGYNKEDVNRYILDTDLKNRETVDKLNRDIEDMGKINIELVEKNERLEAQNAERTAAAVAMEAELERLKKEIAAQTENLADMTKKCDFYRAQSEAQREALNRLREEKSALAQKNEALTDELCGRDEQIKANAAKYASDMETLKTAYEAEIEQIKASASDESVAYKLDMYDKISSQIGDILINANRNADDMISSAKQEAERILARTAEEVSSRKAECEKAVELQQKKAEAHFHNVRSGISSSAEHTLSALRDEFSGNMNNCVREIQTGISEMQCQMNALMSLLKQKQEEMNERIEFYHGSVSDSVDERLEVMQEECDDIVRTGMKNDG